MRVHEGAGGHFLLESGYHTDLWLSLETLFVDPASMAPDVEALAALVRPHRVTAVCGPLLGGAFLAQALAMALGARFYCCEPAGSDGTELFGARYRLPAGQRDGAAKERLAVVDDVISAGSSVRAVVAELDSVGAQVAIVGALMVLGTKALEHFEGVGLPVVALEKRPFPLWLPGDCPLCAAGAPLIQGRSQGGKQ